MQTNLRSALVAVGISALGLLSACSGAGEDPGTPETASPSSVVAALAVDGYVHTFVDDGDGSVNIMVRGSDSYGKPAVFRLLEKYGDLTALELYLAMAPEGSTVDDRLVAAHSIEAEALGRPDDSVHAADLDAAGVVEKGSLANCLSWALSKKGGSQSGSTSSSFVDNATLTMSSQTTNKIASAICNTSWSSSDAGLAGTVERQIGTGSWTQIGSSGDDGSPFIRPQNANASDDNSWAFVGSATMVAKRWRLNGFWAAAPLHHTYYMAIVW